MSVRAQYLLAVVGAALVTLSGVVTGQESPQVERDANEIYNSVMSPFCPGRLLANCPSTQAADLRESVKAQLVAGVAKDVVLDQLYAEWGEEILGAPRGAVAWIVPIGGIGFGALFLFLWLFRARRAMGAPDLRALAVDAASEERLQTELSKL